MVCAADALEWQTPQLASAVGRYHAFVDHFPVTQPAYNTKSVPAFLKRFDWVLSEPAAPGVLFPSHRGVSDPKTVFAVSNALEQLLELAVKHFDASRRDRIVVFAASDIPLSQALGRSYKARSESLALLRTFFERVFYEAKDVPLQGIMTMPIGLAEFYLSRGVATNASFAIRTACLDEKPRAALAAWGAYWTLDNPSRLQAQLFVESPGAKLAGVDFAVQERRSWWGQLSKYRFLIIPAGSRIQCVKMIEALLVLTIPIVQRGRYRWAMDPYHESAVIAVESDLHADGVYPVYDDLVQLGFPLVVVDDWRDITRSNLSRWWQELSPRLVNFRRHCLNVEGYWRMIHGNPCAL